MGSALAPSNLMSGSRTDDSHAAPEPSLFCHADPHPHTSSHGHTSRKAKRRKIRHTDGTRQRQMIGTHHVCAIVFAIRFARGATHDGQRTAPPQPQESTG